MFRSMTIIGELVLEPS